MVSTYPVDEWVSSAPADQKEFRQAVHTILVAIAENPKLSDDMIIKGGILLAIRYNSHRYTKDIDFSTSKMLKEVEEDGLRELLDASLSAAVEKMDYELDCRIQHFRVQPANVENPTFPEIEMSIGYAYKGTTKHKRLLLQQCPTVIKVDYSLNEPTPNVEYYEIGKEESLRAYSLTDLIAEKLRAFLQQSQRNRMRRQDIFDLYLLLDKNPGIDDHEKRKILESLLQKSRSRDVFVDGQSFRNEELRGRAKAHYPDLTAEVEGELPDFDEIYQVVCDFYESLPW